MHCPWDYTRGHCWHGHSGWGNKRSDRYRLHLTDLGSSGCSDLVDSKGDGEIMFLHLVFHHPLLPSGCTDVVTELIFQGLYMCRSDEVSHIPLLVEDLPAPGVIRSHRITMGKTFENLLQNHKAQTFSILCEAMYKGL